MSAPHGRSNPLPVAPFIRSGLAVPAALVVVVVLGFAASGLDGEPGSSAVSTEPAPSTALDPTIALRNHGKGG